MFRNLRSRIAIVIATGIGLAASLGGESHAGWLTRLGTLAGETGSAAGAAARLGLSALERAAVAVKAHPPSAKTVALAAHVTPEGHWKFANAAGEVFTAGTPDELARAVPRLAPEVAEGKTGLTLYLTEGTVFEGRERLRDLPSTAELKVVAGDDAFSLVRRNSAGKPGVVLYAEVRPGIAVEVSDLKLFDEALWQLRRPLNKADIRVVALEPGGPEQLASTPRFEPGSRNALVDAIDPGRLAGALGKLKGQTVLLTAAVEGDVIRFTPARGGTEALSLKELLAAAEDADVNLVILESSTPRQPGGRNWLWQRVEVAGLDEAIRRATFADFLSGLAAGRGELLVSASAARGPRVALTAVPSASIGPALGGAAREGLGLERQTRALADWANNWASEFTGHVTGKVVPLAVHAHVMSSDRQREMDWRFVRFIPAWLQGAFLFGVAAGLVSWRVAWAWWQRLWPAEARGEYASFLGYQLAGIVRLVAFLVLFLPFAGAPALLAMLTLQLWQLFTLPLRLWRRARGVSAAS